MRTTHHPIAPRRSIHRRSRPVFASLLVVASLAIAACGSDSDDAGSATTDPVATDATAAEDTATTEADSAADDPTAYCEAELALEVDPGPDVDFPTASDEEVAAAFQAYAAGPLEELLRAVEEVVPAELEDAAETFRTVVDDIAETGDVSAFESPEMAAATAEAHAYDLEHCDWNQADLTASDYEFGGLEDTYEAGPISFDLENLGKELHEMVIVRVNDDVDLTVDELLALPEEEVMTKIEDKGMVDPVAPGDTGYAVVDLEPGRHIVLCFLPEGATDFPTLEQLGPDAQPHAAMGMIQELTVT